MTTAATRTPLSMHKSNSKCAPVLYTAYGKERSCLIKIIDRRGGYFRYPKNHIVVTLKRAGHLSHSRELRLDKGIFQRKDGDSHSYWHNQDRMKNHWHYSMLSGRDVSPEGTGRGDKQLREDPGYLIWKDRDHLHLLTVVASANTSGKWQVQPMGEDQRRAICKANQDAKAAASDAYRKQMEREDQDALAFMKSAQQNAAAPIAYKQAKAERADSSISENIRRADSGSAGSTSAKKGPRTSITSVATNNTSTMRRVDRGTD